MRKHLLLGLLVALIAGCGDDPKPPKDLKGTAKPDPNNETTPNIDTSGWADKPRVLIEAETAKCVKPFKTGDDAKAGGGKYLVLPSLGCSGGTHVHLAKDQKDPKRTAGSAELEFTVAKAGDYVLWMRKWTCCSCGDSWKVQIDDGKAFTFGNQGTTHRHWAWLAHQDSDGKLKLKLTKGKHKLKLINRGESGFRIDQILFWADHKHAPAGKEKG